MASSQLATQSSRHTVMSS